MRITMLAENHKSDGKFKLKAEHGLSMLIELPNIKILFDCGASGVFMENAKTMGIDIQEIDLLILSHAHADHAGGLIKFFEENRKAKVIMSPYVKERYFFRIFGFPIDVSVPMEIFQKFSERIIYIKEFTEILDDVFIIPEIKAHPYPLVKSNKKLLVKKNERYIEDDFKHEIILAVKINSKLVIFTGCSHNGIDNMILACRDYFPKVPISSVIGGFHLMGIPFKNMLGDSKVNIKALGNRIKVMNIDKVYTCHCTGMKAFSILKKVMDNRLEYFNTGMQIEITENTLKEGKYK